MALAVVFVGAGLGGVSRFLMGEACGWVLKHVPLPVWFPWPTMLVNLSGCFAAGVLMAYLAKHAPADTGWAQLWKLALGVGFLGGYTTFSAFGRETLEMLQQGRVVPAALYALASTVLGVLAVWVGTVVVR